MARCPYCGHILEDAWIKREGAAAMGRTRGPSKARTTRVARDNALMKKEKNRRRKIREHISDVIKPPSGFVRKPARKKKSPT